MTPEQKENLALIEDTASKLSLLVNDLIDAIKLRHEDLQLDLIIVDLHVVTQVVFQLLSFDLQGKKVKLVNRIKPRTFVSADENRLRQILYNISSNAVKYTEKGEITADTIEKDGTITLTISDTGIGIPAESWEKVFQDFYQDALADRQHSHSMGLGLYISRQLAQKMNGDLWISDSLPGRGTTLSLRLPKGYFADAVKLQKSILVKKEYPKRTKNSEKGSETAGDLKKILLVDDAPTNIRILFLTLKGEYRVSAAYSGEEALSLLRKEKFHLVITDMMMPGMSGIELISQIRKTYSPIDLPVIIATVRDGDKDIELAYQNGASDYITKPFTAEEIQRRVRNLLQLTDTMERALSNEMAFLQAQIKPHFLYNALSNIIALCYEDGEKAAELLSLLSRYLRYIFQTDQVRQQLQLRQELDIIKAYVEIETLRFGERLSYETYIDSGLLEGGVMIPPLLIQPLVENAIRHGLFNKQGAGTVILSIAEGKDFLRIIVEDDGIGMSDEEIHRILYGKDGKGVGIRNIQMRIASWPNASLSIDSQLEQGTRCILTLPKGAV